MGLLLHPLHLRRCTGAKRLAEQRDGEEKSLLSGEEGKRIDGFNDWEKVFMEKGLHESPWLVVKKGLEKCSAQSDAL